MARPDKLNYEALYDKLITSYTTSELINLSNHIEIQIVKDQASKSYKKKFFARVGAGNNGKLIKEKLAKRGCWRIMDPKTWKKIYKKLKMKKTKF
jgi:hypothetical protein